MDKQGEKDRAIALYRQCLALDPRYYAAALNLGILLSEEFYDEDLDLVKAMVTLEIQMMGDRLFPKIWRMQKADAVDEYTELDYRELEFRDDLPANLFTLTNLKTPRRVD